MDLLSKGIGLGLEPLSCNEAVPIDYEQTLFQVLVNEGKHIRVRNNIAECILGISSHTFDFGILQSLKTLSNYFFPNIYTLLPRF